MNEYLKGLPFTLKAHFKKYRNERLKKECPMCIDLHHGYVEGCNAGYNEKQGTLTKQNEILKKALESIIKYQNELDWIYRSDETEDIATQALKEIGEIE